MGSDHLTINTFRKAPRLRKELVSKAKVLGCIWGKLRDQIYATYKGFERVIKRHISTLSVDYGRLVPLHWHKARPQTPKLWKPALSATLALSEKY